MSWEPEWESEERGGVQVKKARTPAGNLWLKVNTYDRSTARVVAEGFGRVTEADVADDGWWSFAVEPVR